MSCQVEQIADCGDLSTLARALFIPEREDENWLCECKLSLSSCGSLLAVGFGTRLCLLTSQWISSTASNTYLISWSGTLPSDVSAVLAVPICPAHQSSQNGPDWICVIVGFKNGKMGFYTNTGHLLLLEKLEEKPVLKISCHTGTYGTLPDDVHVLFQSCVCIISGGSLFQTLRNAKAQLARGLQAEYSVDNRSLGIRRWTFSDQEALRDAAVVGLDLKNSYDHLLMASTYGGYDTWYRSIPPMNTLVLGAGESPYIGFHYALEGGTNPPLQDVARAVANKIKSALPGWLGGGSVDQTSSTSDPLIRTEPLSMRAGLFDERLGAAVAVSPDRRLAAVADSVGRVTVLDVRRGYVVRMIKGCRDAQCAFVQVFDIDNKKPQLSVVKELRRAMFLIIYNPKKGLVDIRLMQRGNRVAVFTATKNGQLIYNTCGLVGAEKNYSHKKLNLPEFQCVLIDPDGKLKKFNIPFFYALEGENSDRSKDLHTLRELREYIKKTENTTEDFETEIVSRVSSLQTLELKQHCLEMLIRKYNVSAKIVMSCLEAFWDSLDEEKLSKELEATKRYFSNLALITLFFRRINNENTDDMCQLLNKIRKTSEKEDIPEDMDTSNEKEPMETLEFELLEDDSCILERLLVLAKESGFRDHQQNRVTFADNNTSTYREFLSCFLLLEDTDYISLKPDTSSDKLNNLAKDTFKLIFGMKDLKMLTVFVKESNIDPKEIAKLVMLHIMNKSLDEISIEMINKLIEVLYYLSSVTEQATNIEYSEISPWWESIRSMLVEMPCPLRSMIIAMACKAVGKMCETTSIEATEAWESVSKENAKWGILIGKLEDISILSIILMFKDMFKGNALPKLPMTDMNINLKYIYTRGKGSITELIAKWLCGMGVIPEAIVANELLEKYADVDAENDDNPDLMFIQNNRSFVDENPKIFKWLSLLRRQFPLSTSATYIVANMCWEYASAWQNSIQKTDHLAAVISCLNNINDLHLRSGVFSIIWSTYIKNIFEPACRLVNKVGRLPKDPLCLQDVGLNSADMLKFLELSTRYLENFVNCSTSAIDQEKQTIQFEKIWDENMPSLVEVAQDTKKVNFDVLTITYQIACTIYYQCHYNIKYSKPLDTLFDVDYQYIFDALAGNVVPRALNMKASDKLGNPRMKYLTKLIRAAVETIHISCEGEGPKKLYNDKECVLWMERISNLAELWGIEDDFIKRQQVISLYHSGYDSLAEWRVTAVKQPAALLPPLLAISTQRLKHCHTHAADPAEWIVAVPPHLYKRLQNTELDTSIPAHPSLETTIEVLQKVLDQTNKQPTESLTPDDTQNVKLAKLIIDTCEVLIRRKL